MNNFSKNKIEATKEFWQPEYEQELSDADALEILDTTYALISFFNEIAEKRQKARERGDFSMG